MLAFALGCFGVLALWSVLADQLAGLVSFSSSKSTGWAWALAFAAVVSVVATGVFAATLVLCAPRGLALPLATVLRLGVLLGAAVPLLLLALRLLARWTDLGGGFLVSLLCLVLLSTVAAACLAVLRPGR